MYKDRARQFIPFAALRGYGDYLREKEFSPAPRRELSEDEAEILSRKRSRVKPGQLLKITYYRDGGYITSEGMISDFDAQARTITVVNEKISLDDVADICGEGVDDTEKE